ncbi:hypothetical protein [Cysteiniphilum sp. JM-1]|uniref:hypothetical protein n=1 Tax=Cysteiniphilum sp. JM-1 TaxID=2610891 RepID=UPI001243BE7C|nr:hypothetical protein [Cysteiniphilum sp. JM-1]
MRKILYFTITILSLLSTFLGTPASAIAESFDPAKFIRGEGGLFTEWFAFTEGTSFLQGLIGQDAPATEAQMQEALAKLDQIIGQVNQVENQLSSLTNDFDDYLIQYNADYNATQRQKIIDIERSVEAAWNTNNNNLDGHDIDYFMGDENTATKVFQFLSLSTSTFMADAQILGNENEQNEDDNTSGYIHAFAESLHDFLLSKVKTVDYSHPINDTQGIFTWIDNYNKTLTLVATKASLYEYELLKLESEMVRLYYLKHGLGEQNNWFINYLPAEVGLDGNDNRTTTLNKLGDLFKNRIANIKKVLDSYRIVVNDYTVTNADGQQIVVKRQNIEGLFPNGSWLESCNVEAYDGRTLKALCDEESPSTSKFESAVDLEQWYKNNKPAIENISGNLLDRGQYENLTLDQSRNYFPIAKAHDDFNIYKNGISLSLINDNGHLFDKMDSFWDGGTDQNYTAIIVDNKRNIFALLHVNKDDAQVVQIQCVSILNCSSLKSNSDENEASSIIFSDGSIYTLNNNGVDGETNQVGGIHYYASNNLCVLSSGVYYENGLIKCNQYKDFLPPGSYQKTCQITGWDGHNVAATCSDGQHTVTSSLDYDNFCQAGTTVHQQEGLMICDHYKDTLPKGSYQQSCMIEGFSTGGYYQPPFLSARCIDRGHNIKESHVAYSQGQTFTNEDGVLTAH